MRVFSEPLVVVVQGIFTINHLSDCSVKFGGNKLKEPMFGLLISMELQVKGGEH